MGLYLLQLLYMYRLEYGAWRSTPSVPKYICFNADLLPPVVAMHACIVFGLCEHDIPIACNVESRR
jgi:hypothetical protein